MPRPHGRNNRPALPNFTHLQVKHTEFLDLLCRTFLHVPEIQESKGNIPLQVHNFIRLPRIICACGAKHVFIWKLEMADLDLS